MCYRIFLPVNRYVAGLLSFFLVTQFSSFSQNYNPGPNIIYIMADDLGYADLSCYGRKDYQTPNLDKLASQGVKFMNAYSASALCTPTRTAFMTGRYPARTQVGLFEPLRGTPKDSLIGLSPDNPSLATLLKNDGYETALIGKWHLGFLPEFSPRKNGFNYFFGFHPGFIDYVSHTSNIVPGPPASYERRVRPMLYENETPIIKKGYITDLIAERTIDYIKTKKEKPFFLSLQFNAPHWPWQGPNDQPYPDTMETRAGGSPQVYAAMMKSLDDAIGSIMKAIDQSGLSRNTIIIFTSDNGGERFSDMGIYSGKKAQLWEGGIRVPAFIRWPGKIPEHSISEQVAITMDWTATILAIAGVKPSPQFPLDGENLLPVLTGQKQNFKRTFYWRLYQAGKQKAIRDGDWKYLENEKGEHLFDLSRDPSEKNDLREKEKQVFENLKNKFHRWEETVLKPVPL